MADSTLANESKMLAELYGPVIIGSDAGPDSPHTPLDKWEAKHSGQKRPRQPISRDRSYRNFDTVPKEEVIVHGDGCNVTVFFQDQAASFIPVTAMGGAKLGGGPFQASLPLVAYDLIAQRTPPGLNRKSLDRKFTLESLDAICI